MTRKIRIAFRGGPTHAYARANILRFIVQGSDRFELCPDGDFRCDAVVLSQPEARRFFDQPTEWDRLVREIGSTDRKPVVVLDGSNEGWQPSKTFRAKIAETLQDTNRKIRRVVLLTQSRFYFGNDDFHWSRGAEDERSRGGSDFEYLYFNGALAKIAADLRGVMEKDGGACLENMFANRVEAWKSPSPRFACLMKKPRPHRIVVMGHLIRTGALKHGNVSFLSHLARGQINAGQSMETEIRAARRQFPQFSDEIDALASFPGVERGFRNFKDDIKDDEQSHVWDIGIGSNANRDTQVALLTETEMAAWDKVKEPGFETAHWVSRRLTEKSLKGPLVWNAFLVCGNLSTLPLLEEVGLGETGFPKDYDTVRGSQERLKAVLDTFDDYLSGSLKLDEGYLWRNRDIHARFIRKVEENAAKRMDMLSRILLDEL